jgi:hypothetical protein
MEGIYEVCCWDGLRRHDMHTRFHIDCFRPSKVDGEYTDTQTARWSHKPNFTFFKTRKVGWKRALRETIRSARTDSVSTVRQCSWELRGWGKQQAWMLCCLNLGAISAQRKLHTNTRTIAKNQTGLSSETIVCGIIVGGTHPDALSVQGRMVRPACLHPYWCNAACVGCHTCPNAIAPSAVMRVGVTPRQHLYGRQRTATGYAGVEHHRVDTMIKHFWVYVLSESRRRGDTCSCVVELMEKR